MSDNGHAITVTEANFQAEVIDRSKSVPVLVDFWAPWCMPCRTLSPVLDRVAADSEGAFVLAKLNTDENPNLAAQYNIRSIPAVKVFRGGRVVDEFIGARPEREVREFVKALAPTQMDRWLMEAASLVYGERWDEAAAAYRRILDAKPGHPQAALELGRMYVGLGKGAEAEATLNEVPADAPERTAAQAMLPLADLLKHVTNGTEQGPDALYAEAARQVAQRRVHDAVETLLDLLRRERDYRDGAGKRAVLALLEYLGDDPAVRDYRRRLASVLF